MNLSFQTIDPPGGKIVRYAGGINFANRGYFKDGLYNLLNIHPKKIQQTANRSNRIYSIETVDKVMSCYVITVINMATIMTSIPLISIMDSA